MSIRGIFVSDIDNTLTDERHLIPDEVVNYLTKMHQDGWEIVFLTGRTFSFAEMSMDKFNFPFILGVQHGAEVVKMPSKEVIYRNFLSRDILADLEEAFDDHSISYIVYSGFEEGDFCYYNPEKFSDKMLDYFKLLQKYSAIAWTPVETHADIKASGFPLVKGFGSRDELEEIEKKLNEKRDISSSIIFDAIDRKKAMLMVTERGVDKGQIFRRLYNDMGWDCPTIAAGDDANDIPLLDEADIAICVQGGSDKVKKHADYVTDPSTELGIIKALDQIFEEHDF